jgi:hypothetical protein
MDCVQKILIAMIVTKYSNYEMNLCMIYYPKQLCHISFLFIFSSTFTSVISKL